jgi:hypothetical protein
MSRASLVPTPARRRFGSNSLTATYNTAATEQITMLERLRTKASIIGGPSTASRGVLQSGMTYHKHPIPQREPLIRTFHDRRIECPHRPKAPMMQGRRNFPAHSWHSRRPTATTGSVAHDKGLRTWATKRSPEQSTHPGAH